MTGPAICPTGRYTNGSPTGPTPKSSPQWPPPSCCSPRSRSSRPAAATPCCLCGYCATATAPANLIMLGWAPASSACSSSSRVHAGRLGLLRAKHRRGLPPTAAVLAGSGAAAQLVPRVGARPPAAAARFRGQRRRPVLAVTDRPARHLHQRTAPGSACCSCRFPWSPGPASGNRIPGWPPACSTPGSRSAARSARGARHRRLDRRGQQRPHPGCRRHGRGRPGRSPPSRRARGPAAGREPVRQVAEAVVLAEDHRPALSCLMPRPKIPPAGAPSGDAKPMQRS